ncbi:Uncharacterised protein [Klebsiella michiganensis]|nr:Uncharacterised protein [Klebsiella michiganensis]
MFDVIVVLAENFFRFLNIRSRWRCPFQRTIGGLFHRQAGNQTNQRHHHQIVSRHHQVLRAFHQPRRQSRRQTGNQHRDVKGAGQGAKADVGRKHRRQRRGHHPDKAVQHHRQQQQTGENQAKDVTVNHDKGRNRQREQRHATNQDERTTAKTVAEHTDNRLNEQHPDHDGDDDQHPVVFRIVQVMRQVARHVGQQHVVGHVGGNHQTDTGQQATPVFGRNLFERDFRPILQALAVALLHFINVLLERRRLFQRMTQIKTDNP